MEDLSKRQIAPIEWFYEICKIPHKSGDEKAMSDKLVDLANKHELEYRRDNLGNIVVIKPASIGRETDETIVLQAHMDMVFETEDNIKYPYGRPILVKEKDGFLYAEGTSLGADNGIGMAIIMAVLSSEISTPRIEAIFTVCEEDGLLGAAGLSSDFFKGRKLINIDGEEDDIVIAGCAGAFRSELQIPVNETDYEALEENEETNCFAIDIKGLHGGHSGLDIDKGRKNAIKLLGEILNKLYVDCGISICDINGGSRMNAIPVSAKAIIRTQADIDYVHSLVKAFEAEERDSAVAEDINLTVSVSCVDTADIVSFKAISCEKTKAIIDTINTYTNGVISRSKELPEFIETSTNLGVLSFTDNIVSLVSNVRSSEKYKLLMIKAELKNLADKLGANVIFDSEYPPWTYEEHSDLRDAYIESYFNILGEKPKVEIIHGGLECGLFSEKYSGLDSISIGPNILNVHSTFEEVSLESVEKIWEVIVDLLKW